MIGFQAKFYATPLYKHTGDLLRTVENAKKYYPKITQLLIYSNRGWGRSSQGKTKVENKADELGIRLKWNTDGFFKSEFVSAKCRDISEHFFTYDRSVFNSIKDRRHRTKVILDQIEPCFHINNRSFDIDTNEYLKQLKNETGPVSILKGKSGVGKTAIVKRLFEESSDDAPFYVFKAIELRISHINKLFPTSSLHSFVDAHKHSSCSTDKIVVIDSAEKLLDIDDLDPLKELLSVLIENGWRVIFTISDTHLGDLYRKLPNIQEISPQPIEVNALELSEIQNMSERYSFALPENELLLDLIRTPFYLNEYLKHYNYVSGLNYDEFKSELWWQNVAKTKSKRAECFIEIASLRARTGQFFISPDCDSDLIDGLLLDGILGYDKTMGHFITHDIYEEWALEKLVERAFGQKLNRQDFFEKIGQSLPVQRSFRDWVSKKLILNEKNSIDFIESVLRDTDIEQSWKDEVLISVLLSNYSDKFFERFKDELLADEQKLLKSIVSLTQTRCKAVDDDLSKSLLKDYESDSVIHKFVFMKPKGPGWESLIKFVHNNIGTIGIRNASFILLVIHDWNSKHKKGATTKFSSLIALRLYEESSSPTNLDKIIGTIIYGASQIKDELIEVCEEILRDGRGSRYYKLSKFILDKMESWPIYLVLPEYVLKIADLLWLRNGARRDGWTQAEIELNFGLDPSNIDLYESSAYQTPIYQLLIFHPITTLKFILSFINKSVQAYVNSNIDSDVTEVDIWIRHNETRKQYVSERLWYMYRRLGPPSPSLLQSIHMALETYLLECGEKAESKNLERLLIYLLGNTKSASISSVVASVVTKYPEKTFNVAKILFQTKEFVSLDVHRLFYEQTTIFSYPSNSERFYNERAKANKMRHRRMSLEDLCFRYQIVGSKSDIVKRQPEIWNILDSHFRNLPPKSEQSEPDIRWRLSLARMDQRKMSTSTEKIDADTHIIKFNPELEPDLDEYQQKKAAMASKAEQHIPLQLWAHYKFEENEKYQKYEQYETNPRLAISETQDVIAKLDKINSVEQSDTPEEAFARLSYFHQTTPSFVCAVILRDHIESLTEEEKNFCYDVVLEVARSTLQPDYQYRLSDGVEPSFAVLPTLFKALPENREEIKNLLLRTLFDKCEVGYSYDPKGLRSFSIKAIRALRERSFDDAQPLLLGYILLASRYDQLCEEYYGNGIYKYSSNELLENVFKENKELLRNIVENRLKLSSLPDDLEEKHIGKLSFISLNVVFQLIPQKPDNDEHKRIAQMLITAFANKVLGNDKHEYFDYITVSRLLDTYAHFVLRANNEEEVDSYLEPVLRNLTGSEIVPRLFEAFIVAEDQLQQYENFWLVWNKFKAKVMELCKTGSRTEIVKRTSLIYLFGKRTWGSGVH